MHYVYEIYQKPYNSRCVARFMDKDMAAEYIRRNEDIHQEYIMRGEFGMFEEVGEMYMNVLRVYDTVEEAEHRTRGK